MKIKLADTIIEIESLHDDVTKMCKDYEIAEGEPELHIVMTQADIDAENCDHNLPDGYIETLAAYRKIAEFMVSKNTVLFHGSAVAIDGRGIILTAPSGTGKSTLARNLKSILGDRLQYINDDKPLVHADENGAIVYGTPWDGKHHLSNNASAKVEAIFIIERAETPWITEIQPREVIDVILQQTNRPDEVALLGKTMEIINLLCQTVKFYRAGIVIDDRSAKQIVGVLGGHTHTSIEQEIADNGWLVYTNVGNSMMPLIEQSKDLVVIKKVDRELKKGDAVLFKRVNGSLVLHRVIHVHDNDGARSYDMCGDNQSGLERGVSEDQIIGILDKVIKNAGTEYEREIEPGTGPKTPVLLRKITHRLRKHRG